MANNLADNNQSDRVYGYQNNVACMRDCDNVDGLVHRFDVWFAAQFLRDKCTATDFGLPRFTDDREKHAVFCTYECKFVILVYPLR